jgi:hypothetical protein
LTPLDEGFNVARKRWIILKDSAAKAELLAEIGATTTGEVNALDDLDKPIENSDEEDLVFTVHYADEDPTIQHTEEKHEPEVDALNPDPFSLENKIAKKPPTQATLSAVKIVQGCEDYMLYLSKHIISPIFIANKKQTPNFSYSQKPWSVEKIMSEAMNKDSFVYALRQRDPRFDIAIMRHMILQICLDSMKAVPKASRSETFKKKYQEFKKYFKPAATIEHDIDLLANITFKKAIGQTAKQTIKKMPVLKR